MLQQVRGALRNIVAYFIIALLVLAFAAWGVPELRHFTQRAPVHVGPIAIGNQEIVREFDRTLNAERASGGKTLTREEALAAGLDDKVVANLTLIKLLEHDADRMGLKMPRSAVVDFIKTDDMFKNPVSKAFDRQRFEQILSQNELSEARFEELLRSDLLRRMMFESIEPGPSAPKALQRALILREIEQRQVSYLVITPDMAGPPPQPTPQVLQAYYEKNKARFKTPEYRTFTAALLRTEDFAAKVEVPEAELQRAYEANKERLYETPEKRTFYQVTFDKTADAEAAVAALRSGKPMGNIAAERGLTLAAVTFADTARKDVLDPKVADAVFAPTLQPGGVADAVKGMFGYTVVQLAGVTPSSVKPFEAVREEIRLDLARSEARKKMIETVSKLEEERDTGSGLAEAAKKVGVAVQSFGPVDDKSFSPDAVVIDKIPGPVLAQAFRLDEGAESEATELPDGAGYFFATVDAVQAPAFRPYAAVAAEVDRGWRSEQARARVAALAKKVKDAVAAGKTLEAEGTALNRAALSAILSQGGPGNEAVSPQFQKALFKADKGATLSAPALLGDAEVVAQVRDIGFARDRVTSADEAQFSMMLSENMNRELADAYVESVKKDVGVRVDKAALDALFAEETQ